MSTQVSDAPASSPATAGSDTLGPGSRGGDRTGRDRSWIVVASLVGAAAALVAGRPLFDNSFLTHLATGRLILDSGVPSENPFLYTGTDFPVPSWWWSILLAVLDDLGGASAIRLLTAAIAGTLGVVLVRTAITQREDRSVASLLSVVAPSLLALVCVFPFLSGRPHLAGFLLLAVVVWVWTEERSPWWIAACFVLWVNIHGSWLYGVVVLVAYGLARAVDDRRPRRRDIEAVLASVAGVVVGGLVYPEPLKIVLLPTRQFGDPVERLALRAYQEWGRVSLDQPILWALIGVSLLAVRGCLRTRRPAMALFAAGLFVMGVSSYRLVPIAAISLVPLAGLGLDGFGSLRMPDGRGARIGSAMGGFLAVAAVVHCFTGAGYDLDRYPVEAIDWLEERDLAAAPEVQLMTHDYAGNYLEWRYGADTNTYVDDRPDAATMVDYAALLFLERDWRDALERADADVVVWNVERPLVEVLDEDERWVRAAELDGFAVFCHVDLAERCAG